jgi:CBS domain-containing protein
MSAPGTSIAAKDLMQRKLVRLQVDTSVEDAIETLEEHGISGAPVVDTSGRLVGVFSARDVARSEHVREGRISTREADDELMDLEGEEDEVEMALERRHAFSSANAGADCVADWMSTELLTVDPDADLRKVCASMARESMHRVFVVEAGKLVGVVSSMDVVRHVAGAVRGLAKPRPERSGPAGAKPAVKLPVKPVERAAEKAAPKSALKPVLKSAAKPAAARKKPTARR